MAAPLGPGTRCPARAWSTLELPAGAEYQCTLEPGHDGLHRSGPVTWLTDTLPSADELDAALTAAAADLGQCTATLDPQLGRPILRCEMVAGHQHDEHRAHDDAGVPWTWLDWAPGATPPEDQQAETTTVETLEIGLDPSLGYSWTEDSARRWSALAGALRGSLVALRATVVGELDATEAQDEDSYSYQDGWLYHARWTVAAITQVLKEHDELWRDLLGLPAPDVVRIVAGDGTLVRSIELDGPAIATAATRQAAQAPGRCSATSISRADGEPGVTHVCDLSAGHEGMHCSPSPAPGYLWATQ